jgi:hypothetical protein
VLQSFVLARCEPAGDGGRDVATDWTESLDRVSQEFRDTLDGLRRSESFLLWVIWSTTGLIAVVVALGLGWMWSSLPSARVGTSSVGASSLLAPGLPSEQPSLPNLGMPDPLLAQQILPPPPDDTMLRVVGSTEHVPSHSIKSIPSTGVVITQAPSPKYGVPSPQPTLVGSVLGVVENLVSALGL